MNTLKQLQDYITEFNKNNEIDLEIDSIRIEFQKQHKLNEIKELGTWKKLAKNSDILHKLKKRLDSDEVTSAYQLEQHHIYYYNMNKDKPKYRIAELVIFGMKQYHQEPPPLKLVESIVNMLTFKNSKVKCNIDVCFDMKYKPNIEKLKAFFDVFQYKHKNGVLTDTYYLNRLGYEQIEKICIYNKEEKNNLKAHIWRIEAKIHIPNIKVLFLPLSDFKSIIDIAKA